jgi:hypothetical protein
MKKIIGMLFLITIISEAYIGCYNDICTEFNSKKNKHGIVLKSTGIQYKWVGSYGAEMRTEKIKNAKRVKKIILYLGKSCDAYSKVYGKGKWEWANGGFTVNFKNINFGFGRQELEIDTEEEFGCQM